MRIPKPAFEIPEEALVDAAEPEAGWVYRTEELQALPLELPAEVSIEEPPTVMTAAIGMWVVSMAAVGIASVATLALTAAPFVVANGLYRGF